MLNLAQKLLINTVIIPGTCLTTKTGCVDFLVSIENLASYFYTVKLVKITILLTKNYLVSQVENNMKI